MSAISMGSTDAVVDPVHELNIGTSVVAYTISGVTYYNYSIMGPKTLF